MTIAVDLGRKATKTKNNCEGLTVFVMHDMSSIYIWALTQENLSSLFANNKGADQSALLFTLWKVSYPNLLQVNFQFSS